MRPHASKSAPSTRRGAGGHAELKAPSLGARVASPAALRDGRTWVAAAVVVAGVLAAHGGGLRNGFNYDDTYNIVDNPHFRGLGGPQLRWMFTTFHLGHYQPLSWVSLAVDWCIWGDDPFGYHLTNLVLHVGASLVVLRLSIALLGAGPAGASHAAWVAATLGTLLWAVHPLRVESVAWVTERRDVLSSFFLLLTVLLYLHAHGGGVGRPSARRQALILGVFVLSLLSRAMAVTLPVILLILDWWPLRRLGGPRGWTGPAARAAYVEKLPFVTLSAIFAIVAVLAQHTAQAAAGLREHGVVGRLAQACYGLVFYLWKTVLPLGLVPLYEMTTPLDVWRARYIVPAVLVLLGGALVIWQARRRPWLATVTLIYAILLAPVLGLVQSGAQEVADRYSYLPLVGWSMLASAGWLALWRRAGARGAARVLTAGAVAAILGLVFLSRAQTGIWSTPLTLWEHAARHYPAAGTHTNYAGALVAVGRPADAVAQYRAALRFAPRDGLALAGLAAALLQTGRLEEAEPAFQEALRAAPRDARLRVQYGNLLRARGRLDEALAAFDDAAQLDPQLAEAHANRGAALGQTGRTEESVAACRRALELNPLHVPARANLATALLALGQPADAIAEFQRALADWPGRSATPPGPRAFEHVRFQLASALARLGRTAEARHVLDDLLRDNPQHGDAERLLQSLDNPGPVQRPEPEPQP